MPSRIQSWIDGQDDAFTDEGVLGRGGMAEVRQVFDARLQRRTALKRLMERSGMEDARARFLAEARITGQLEHPHIVPVYEFGVAEDGRDFLNMKLIEGQTLTSRVRELGDARLEPEHLAELIEVLQKVCDAVAFAHSRGIVHRDLKPANVMLGSYGQVYVVDWGVALVKGDGGVHAPADPEEVIGTPSYLAPEQAEGPDVDVDHRADVYALGGILYFMLTARPPHQGRSAVHSLMKAVTGDIPAPSAVVGRGTLPQALARTAMKALARRPEDRFRDVPAFRTEIDRFLRGAWHLPSRTVEAGVAIVREGEPGDEAFVITSGRCRVLQEGRGVIRELGPGDVFGELAVIASTTRTSTVEAVTEVTLGVVDRELLEEGLHAWTGTFVRALARRFRELERKLRDDT